MWCQASPGRAWLRLVPEPERLLPRAVAALRTGTPEPSRRAVETEHRRFQAVLVHETQPGWLALLSDVARLAAHPVPAALQPDALLAAEVVRDHHRLLIEQSPALAWRTRRDRARLEQLVRRLRAAEPATALGSH